jgi:hypothetical protein
LLGDTDVDAFVAGLRPLLDARLRVP